MPQSLRQRSPATWTMVGLLSLFVLAGLIRFWNVKGDDLASSYMGCRVVATGQAQDLYDHDPENFADVGPDKVWQDLAAQGNYHSFLHPYVQTPLWAWSLQPMCKHMEFPVFKHIFLLLALLAMAALVYVVARFWTPLFLHPLAMALLLLALSLSQPFGYAMFLVQTQVLYLVLTVAGLILAERGRPISAGLLVAYAAAIKLTPAALLVYWIFTRRWRAAISLAVWSVVLLVLTRLAVGPHILALYFADLHRVSRILLVAENNQSFAAWVMGRFYSPDEIFDVNVLPLPAALRLGSGLLLLVCAAVGGLLDRNLWPASASNRTTPLGAAFALTGMTIFAPIAWTHYFIILVVPLMMLVQESRYQQSSPNLQRNRKFARWSIAAPAAMAAIIAVLNYPPLASQVVTMDLSDYALLRGQFYAGVLCLGAIAFTGWPRRRSPVTAVGAR